MIREHLMKAHPERDGAFRWRGDGVSRIEGLSDAVFGFAITLLVVSLEVPRTFDELLAMMFGFPAFAATFTLLVLIWAAQYRFFRRYGLEDGRTVLLNVVLLFVVVFFIYPLKFLFQTFIGLWMGGVGFAFGVRVLQEQARGVFGAVRQEQWPAVMVVFGLGYVAVYLVFALLHRHALGCAHSLALDAHEVHETRSSIWEHLTHAGVAAASMALTLVLAYAVRLPPPGPLARAMTPEGFAAAIGGFAYFLEWPAQTARARVMRRRRDALDGLAGLAPRVAPAAEPVAGGAQG